jgi:hypothetical protein
MQNFRSESSIIHYKVCLAFCSHMKTKLRDQAHCHRRREGKRREEGRATGWEVERKVGRIGGGEGAEKWKSSKMGSGTWEGEGKGEKKGTGKGREREGERKKKRRGQNRAGELT